MTNEEFQRIVLEELSGLKEGQGKLETGQKKLEGRIGSLEGRMESLEGQMEGLESKFDAVIEQTAILTEFKEETIAKLDVIIEENKIFKEIFGEHEVDIRRIKKLIV
ncbi:MAG: hypothetical protein ACQEP4_09310 [Bacillota bacterium]